MNRIVGTGDAYVALAEIRSMRTTASSRRMAIQAIAPRRFDLGVITDLEKMKSLRRADMVEQLRLSPA